MGNLVLVDVENADPVHLGELWHHADGHHRDVDDEMHFVVARVHQREEEDDDRRREQELASKRELLSVVKLSGVSGDGVRVDNIRVDSS